MRKIVGLFDIKGMFSNFTSAMVGPLFFVLLSPKIIQSFDYDGFGLWVLGSTLLSVVTIFSFGGKETVVRFSAIYFNSGDIEKAYKVFGSIATVFSVSFGFGALIFIVLYFYLNVKGLSEFDIIFIYLSLACLKQIEVVFSSFYLAAKKTVKYASINLLSKLLQFLVQYGCLSLTGLGMEEIFLVSLVAQLACMIYIAKKIGDNFTGCRLLIIPSSILLKEMWEFARWVWASSVVSVVASYVDRWAIMLSANMEFFGKYSLAIMVLNQMHLIVSSSFSWLLPRYSSNQTNTGVSNTGYIYHLAIYFVGMVGAIILMNCDILFELWLGEEEYMKNMVLIKNFIALIPLSVCTIFPFYFITASGLSKKRLISELMSAVVKISVLTLLFLLYSEDLAPVAIAFSIFSLVVMYELKSTLYDDAVYRWVSVITLVSSIMYFLANYQL